MKKRGPILAAILCLYAALIVSGYAADEGFSLSDEPGQYLDVLLDGRIAARYMYAHDISTKERLHETYKPYLHVFDVKGEKPITKGAGGKYTHHRGMFIGWNKLGFGGKVYDRWHMKEGQIVHKEFLKKEAGKDQALLTSVTHWNDENGEAVVREERTMVIRRAAAPFRLLIDFTAKLEVPKGDVMLDGDPEHAGIQYRPADEVVVKETVYVFPKEGADPRKDLDLPWAAETYTLDGKRHSVVHMNHPDNPKKTRYSAYRDYGRFGAFFKKEIKSGESLTVNYRFMIADGEMPPRETIQKGWEEFAGRK